MLFMLEFLTLRDRGEGIFPFLCPHPVTPFSILPYLILKYLMTMGKCIDTRMIYMHIYNCMCDVFIMNKKKSYIVIDILL